MYTTYGYGTYGYGEDYSVGAYNPRYHYAAAQSAGFDLRTDDGLPKTIYVGNLDLSVTEEFIATLFGQIGPVTKTKVIFDTTSDPYAFVEFTDHTTAAQALQAMNKRMLLDKEMKVNWAIQPGTQQKVDTSKHFHIFVGDLSPEIDNKALKDAFAPFGEVSDAKVIRDPATLMSKGYGFCSFPKRDEAERAIEQMNGQWLGRRTIRTNWATRKPGMPGMPGGVPFEYNKPTVDEIMAQTSPDNTSVYIGGVPPGATETEIRDAFKRFGNIVDIRHFKPQGYAFVKFDTKIAAGKAIAEMNNGEFLGQTIRMNWGKVEGAAPKEVPGIFNPATAGVNPSTVAAVNSAQMQQYWQYYQQCQQNPQWASYFQGQQK
uniref:RRM domain-containing protein n=3 Tax=Meloidogyne incognita group TaxID=654580 RepID=A0A914KIF7_MELIC